MGQEFDVPEGQPLPKVGDKAKGAKVVEVLTWKVCYQFASKLP